MLTGTEKGERLDAEMHSINLFSDAYIRQVEATFAYKPKSHDEFSQPTHRRRRPAFILQLV